MMSNPNSLYEVSVQLGLISSVRELILTPCLRISRRRQSSRIAATYMRQISRRSESEKMQMHGINSNLILANSEEIVIYVQ